MSLPTPLFESDRAASVSRFPATWRPSVLDRLAAESLRRRLLRSGVGFALADEVATLRPAIRLRDGAALRRLLLRPSVAAGDAFCAGALDVDGDLDEVLRRLFDAAWNAPPGLGSRALRLAQVASDASVALWPAWARRRATPHYDAGNDFYALWLDRRLVYTCAYFADASATLEAAQEAKLDLVCRKLRLKEGDRVVELGGGWGALALHMAGRYGARVRSFNVSEEQTLYAREAARRSGLADRVEFVLDDYRRACGSYDAVASVGMLEHVGRAGYASLGRLLASLLAPNGRGLLQSVGRHRAMPTQAWIRRHVFPGGYAPSLGETRAIFEAADLAVLHVENLGEHYEKTLEHWLARFRRHRHSIAARHGEPFARRWELYLASSRASFATGWSQLYQIVFAAARRSRPVA